MDQESIDRIRTATFPTGRRGYDKREVDKFLTRLADWLETGGAEHTPSDAIRRELEQLLVDRFEVDHTTLQIDHAHEELLQIGAAPRTSH